MTANYRPTTAWQQLLDALQSWPNRVGLAARRRLGRAWAARALADFDRAVAGLGPGDIAIDFGAHAGSITRQMAATGAEVHAYEPDPDNFAALEAATADLPNVRRHQAAVGAVAGEVILNRPPAHLRQAYSGLSSVIFARTPQYEPERLPVEQRDFLGIVNGFDRPVRLIKMDVEGAEFDILRGVFADPAAFRFEDLFVETHETRAQWEIPEVDRMRREAVGLGHPRINLYWP